MATRLVIVKVMKLLRKIIVGKNSQFLGTAIKHFLTMLKIGKYGEGIRLPYRFRVIVAESVPQDPFKSHKSGSEEVISVMIPCVQKDLPFLATCIEGVKRNTVNTIDHISIITNCPDLIRSVVDETILIVDEANYLPQAIRNFIEAKIPETHQGWVTKQILVMYFVYMSDLDGVLTVDADTIMLKPRTFLYGRTQLIFPVVEYASHDAITTSRTWKQDGTSLGISFKSHHMLMQPRIVREMFDSLGGFESGSIAWLDSTLSKEWLPFSEFHSYATWIINRHSNQVKLSRWGNLRVSRTRIATRLATNDTSALYGYIEANFPDYNSVSFHHYLPKDFVGSEVE